MKKVISNVVNKLGYEIKPLRNHYPDLEIEFTEIMLRCQSETMTSIERMYGLYKACEYISKNNIPGDFVECGVWRGGSSMVAALTFLKYKINSKKFYLYDTYEGMSMPTEDDISINNEMVSENWDQHKQQDTKIFAKAALEIVKNNIQSTGYPTNLINYIKGKVEETIPKTIPDQISMLRLDTDWYESTKHELEYLYPKLVSGGVLIIDDYGHWQGARKAVDEYFNKLGLFPFLHRLDYTGRLMIKP